MPSKMLEVILPAAGYATRLWPLTKNKPKALLKIADKPIIEHIFAKLAALPVERVSIVTNAKFYENFLEWNSNFNFKAKIDVLNDGTTSNETRLGSIGDINFAIEKQGIKESNSDLLIINADNLFTFDLTKAYNFFKEKNKDTIILYDVKSKKEASKHGVPELDENFRVIGFEEKPAEPKSTLCSIGIYFYTNETIPLFAEYLKEGNSADKTGEFVEWLYKRKEVYGFSYSSNEDKWFDIGTIESLTKAREEFPNI